VIKSLVISPHTINKQNSLPQLSGTIQWSSNTFLGY